MKKRRLFSLILSICMVLTLVFNAASANAIDEEPGETVSQDNTFVPSATGDQSVDGGSHTIDAQRPLLGSDKILKTAGSAILYEVNSDTVMYTWNADTQTQPASLVKVMTALLALEKGQLAAKITISATAMAAIETKNATLKLQVGEELTLEQLMYCLLVGGANDAAVVIADHIGGSQQGFVKMMNDRAAELGCTGTVFTNAHGIHDGKQATTARDMVKILREAIKHEEFTEYFGATAYELPATNLHEARYMETSNFMMTPSTFAYYYSRVTGGRTGVTNDRKRSLIVTAENEGILYIGVVMDAVPVFEPDGYTAKYFGSYEEMRDMLRLGFEGMQVTQVLQSGQTMLQYPVVNADNALAAGPSKSVSTVLPSDLTIKDLSIVYQNSMPNLTAPVHSGDEITTVQVWYRNVCVAESPIVAMHNALDVTQADNSADYNGNGGNPLLAVVAVAASLAVIALAIVGVLYLPGILKRRTRRLYRRRRQDRRRSK